jgi:hypothetical protein
LRRIPEMSEFVTEIDKSGYPVRFIHSDEIQSIKHESKPGIYSATLKDGSEILINSRVYDLRTVLKTNLEHVRERVES